MPAIVLITKRLPHTNVGPPQATYAPQATFTALGPFTGVAFGGAGEKLMRFTITGANAASTGHQLFLDYVKVRKQLVACAPAQTIATGDNHSCALIGSGGVRCWGDGQYGQLGTGGLSNGIIPAAFDAVAGAQAIAAGDAHTWHELQLWHGVQDLSEFLSCSCKPASSWTPLTSPEWIPA